MSVWAASGHPPAALAVACGAITAMLRLTGLLCLARAVPQPVTT